MNDEEIIAEIRRYDAQLTTILARFTRDQHGIHIAQGDDALLRQLVREIVDLFHDALGPNPYSKQIGLEFQEGTSNWIGSPSYRSVENILAEVRAVLTRLARNSDLLTRRKSAESIRRRENIFIIHGRNEAKWRELKDIVRSEFRLNPIILQEQADAGCKTVIEKFEHYAPTCSYAIAVFTPDDEVTSDRETYLQARPNVIYELGWFSARLTRSGVMLLLKEGTSVFSDFGGIIQKRFARNIAERIVEIRRDLVAAGVMEGV